MKLNQSKFTAKTYTLADLITAKTALTGEQAPLNQKTVDAITDDLYAGKELKQPIEVTLYDGQLYLTGGRHRLAGIKAWSECATECADLSYDGIHVRVLEYKVDTAEELLDRILSSNESRRMTKSGEVKLLRTACKHGFVEVTVASLIAKIVDMTSKAEYNTKEVKQLLIMALSMHMMTDLPDTYTTDVTASKVATSIISNIGKGKRGEREHTIETTHDGVTQVSRTTEKYNIIEELLDTASTDSLFEFIDNVVFVLSNAEVIEVSLPASLFSDALMTEALRDCVLTTAELDVPTASYFTTIKPPSALQYNAAGYAKLVTPAILSRLVG